MTKRFWGTLALDAVGLDIRPGQVRALLGQNGAGKSTLIKILAGVYQADAGTADFGGVDTLSERSASPIAFVHQDRGLAVGMTVAENIALTRGYPRGLAGQISWAAVERQARAVLESMQLEIDPMADVAGLTLAEQALVAIARAIATSASFVVLDEPTAALPTSAVERLVDAIRRLRNGGVGFLYVTHRIDEVFELADTVTVLRDGRVVLDADIPDVTRAGLIRAIVGHEMPERGTQYDQRPSGDCALELRDITVRDVGPVTLRVARGETVGLIGLSGAGQSELGRVIAGALQPSTGIMELGGTVYSPASVADALRHGVGLVAGDRLQESLAAEMTVQENLYINPAVRDARPLKPRLRRPETVRARAALRRFDVRPLDPGMPISVLSGGNQQKVVIARWIEAGVSILVLEEPTAGVDIGAKAQVHDFLCDLANAGGTLVVVSSDFDEISGLCDRVLVLSRGHVATELAGDQIQVSALTAWASGAHDGTATCRQHDKGSVR